MDEKKTKKHIGVNDRYLFLLFYMAIIMHYTNELVIFREKLLWSDLTIKAAGGQVCISFSILHCEERGRNESKFLSLRHFCTFVA